LIPAIFALPHIFLNTTFLTQSRKARKGTIPLTKPRISIKIGRRRNEGIARPAMQIVPSILAENLNDSLPLIRQGESFASYVQIDLMDGLCGSLFIPAVIDKVEKARRLFEQKIIAVDGGVSADNLPLFLDAGVDYACVGSRIFLGGNPADNYKNFTRRLDKLEETKK
jgi:pentose-5-phosphate-3-epimerase